MWYLKIENISSLLDEMKILYLHIRSFFSITLFLNDFAEGVWVAAKNNGVFLNYLVDSYQNNLNSVNSIGLIKKGYGVMTF